MISKKIFLFSVAALFCKNMSSQNATRSRGFVNRLC